MRRGGSEDGVKVKPVLVVDGEVIRLEVRVRVEEEEAEAEANEKGLKGHVAWLGLVAREVAGMSWENENDLSIFDTVQLVADGRGWLTFAALLHQRRRGQPMTTTQGLPVRRAVPLGKARPGITASMMDNI